MDSRKCFSGRYYQYQGHRMINSSIQTANEHLLQVIRFQNPIKIWSLDPWPLNTLEDSIFSAL